MRENGKVTTCTESNEPRALGVSINHRLATNLIKQEQFLGSSWFDLRNAEYTAAFYIKFVGNEIQELRNKWRKIEDTK